MKEVGVSNKSVKNAAPSSALPSVEPAQTLDANLPSRTSLNANILDSYLQELTDQIDNRFFKLYNDFESSRTRCRPNPGLKDIISHFGSSVISSDAFSNLEMPKIMQSVINSSSCNEFLTSYGLLNSVCDLPTNYQLISERQEALKELANNQDLKHEIINYLNTIKTSLLDLSIKPTHDQPWYLWHYENKIAVKKAVSAAEKLPECQSLLLNRLFEIVKDFKNTEIARHYTTGSLLNYDGITPAQDKEHNKCIKFWPYPVNTAMLVPATAFLLSIVGYTLSPDYSRNFSNPYIILAGLSAVTTYLISFAKIFTDVNFILLPLLEKARTQTPPIISANVLLSEFIALTEHAERSSVPRAFANPIEADETIFIAENMGSPLHDNQANFVLNSTNISGSEIMCLAGPNSGGKTTFIKSVLLNQIFNQLGAKGFFSSGSFASATRINYIVPKQNDSASSEGRFGEELQDLARSILNIDVDSKTLLGIDEICSGTSEQAATAIAIPILNTTQFCGIRTILATHNLGLVEAFDASDLKVNFFHPGAELRTNSDGSQSLTLTRKILAGQKPSDIDPVIYARLVAQRIGLEAEQLEQFKKEWAQNRQTSVD